MRNYPNAAGGLGKIFLSQVLAIVGTLLAALWILGVIGSLLMIASQVVYLVGLYQARQDDEGYSTAFYLAVAQLILNLVCSFLVSPLSSLYQLCSIAESVLSLLVVYLVCRTTSMLAYSMGREELGRFGHTVWMVNLVCVVVSVGISLLVVISPMLIYAAAGLAVLVTIAGLVGSIMYMVFIYRASKLLA